jgi:hypothetical protein
MRRGLLCVAVTAGLLLAAANAYANAPAPWHACDGLKEGDRCGMGHYYDGYCVLQTDQCTDDASTAINECLWCDNSEAGDDGGGCSMVPSPISAVLWIQALAAAIGLGIWLRKTRRR